MEKKSFDFDAFVKEAGEQLRSGKPLVGAEGVFTPLLKRVIEASLEGEMDEHLKEKKRPGGNRRNGHTQKNIQSSLGGFDIFSPRDRDASFEPQTVAKRQRVISEDMDQKILSLYGMGLSYSDIQKHLKEIYDFDISDGTLTAITDRIIPAIKEWQNRVLESVYPVVWLDAIHFKVRQDGVVKTRAIYSILAVSTEGQKEVIGIYFGENEGAAFWRSVLADLRHRGVEDICIACIDNLKGFAEAIEDLFPQTEVQLCLVHQMRNSMKYMNWKDLKPFVRDLKQVYKAVNAAMGLHYLEEAEKKWGARYSIIFKSWRANWERLSTFFNYSPAIRKIIYTTNPIESYHRMVRKVTKTKGAFSSEDAIVKQIYLATINANTRWQGTMFAWTTVRTELTLKYGDRLNK
ncbi:IS256 family transposase [Flaviaesturariibacter flavus]|uniref:Mutator family transposase n=6 Tax=Flaviaesturariibacter flavus TaxID=2502780 RepID=A0A4R1B732_9BACT|nr:IS256 family transposase [Flaviaesturariibacter flavus]TCJ12657.1 IS256 family transposase [Flaviaesturariibacter flavus]